MSPEQADRIALLIDRGSEILETGVEQGEWLSEAQFAELDEISAEIHDALFTRRIANYEASFSQK